MIFDGTSEKKVILFFCALYTNLLMSGENIDQKISKTFFYEGSHITCHFVLNFKKIKT